MTGSDKGDEWGLQALTVPSDDADTTAQHKLATPLGGEKMTQTHLVLIAQQDVIHPVRMYLRGLTERGRLKKGELIEKA